MPSPKIYAINGGGGRDVLIGTEVDDLIYGKGGNDVLKGGGGNDKLDGGTGNDAMVGGVGDDTYFVDSVGDTVLELEGEGEDTIASSITFSLSSTPHVENLVLTGTAHTQGYGNGLDNDIIGNSGNNLLFGFGGDDLLKGGGGDDTLVGGSGDDTMSGGSGNDNYDVDSYDDVVYEASGQGTDTVRTSINGYWLDSNVENLTLTGSGDLVAHGNDLNNVIIGNSGNNDLYGGLGVDTMQGGAGIDVYIVDNEDDVVIEFDGEGDGDAVISTASYKLSANVEDLFLNGTDNLNGFGNDLDNRLFGNAGNNTLSGYDGDDTLDGGLGSDTMYGGEGNDRYVVDDAGDIVFELSGDGDHDGIQTRGDMDYSLVSAAFVENLFLDSDGHGVNATGNTLNNHIWGNNTHNVIDGGLGADSMFGQGGDDSYIVDSLSDHVFEDDGEGIDTVFSSVDHTLADNVENLSLASGNAVSGSGNGLANTIYGNAGTNVLNGRGGADSMNGMGGNDTFVFIAGEASGDTIYEFEGNGAAGGDRLVFSGYGTAAQGATFVWLFEDTWQITSADGQTQEQIHLNGSPNIDASDYFFI